MMKDLNKYIGLPYDALDFNCWHLMVKVLHEVYGIAVPNKPSVDGLRPFTTQLEKPVEGCMVLMFPFSIHTPDHVGVFIGDGQVLHCHGAAPSSVINLLRSCKRLYWKIEYYAFDNCTL